jgi:chemotaxis protein MotB
VGKKVRHEEHENLERWLVSYADFITLLFAFFTVLYATSQTDQSKLEAVVEAMRAAFEGGMPLALLDEDPEQEPPDIPNLVPNRLISESAEPTIYSLKRNLQGSLSDHVVQLGLIDQKLTLVLPERLLFARGSAELHPSAYAVLARVARVLRAAPATIEVVGHADGIPVTPGSPFEDNWGLASARSLTTVRYLARKGVPVENLQAGASVTAASNQEARAVTIHVHVDEPAPAADVAHALDDGTREPAEE